MADAFPASSPPSPLGAESLEEEESPQAAKRVKVDASEAGEKCIVQLNYTDKDGKEVESYYRMPADIVLPSVRQHQDDIELRVDGDLTGAPLYAVWLVHREIPCMLWRVSSTLQSEDVDKMNINSYGKLTEKPKPEDVVARINVSGKEDADRKITVKAVWTERSGKTTSAYYEFPARWGRKCDLQGYKVYPTKLYPPCATPTLPHFYPPYVYCLVLEANTEAMPLHGQWTRNHANDFYRVDPTKLDAEPPRHTVFSTVEFDARGPVPAEEVVVGLIRGKGAAEEYYAFPAALVPSYRKGDHIALKPDSDPAATEPFLGKILTDLLGAKSWPFKECFLAQAIPANWRTLKLAPLGYKPARRPFCTVQYME